MLVRLASPADPLLPVLRPLIIKLICPVPKRIKPVGLLCCEARTLPGTEQGFAALDVSCNGGCTLFGGLLLRRQELTLGAGSVRQQPSTEVGQVGCHLSKRRDRLYLLGV